MAAQGSGGAYEISQRMTAMIGWGGTANFKEDWAYDQARLERISVLETALVFSLPAQTNCNVGGAAGLMRKCLAPDFSPALSLSVQSLCLIAVCISGNT